MKTKPLKCYTSQDKETRGGGATQAMKANEAVSIKARQNNPSIIPGYDYIASNKQL